MPLLEKTMLTLYIGNKNYSSWSMRPWVLLEQAGIPFEEVVVRFDSFSADSQFKKRLCAATRPRNATRFGLSAIRRHCNGLRSSHFAWIQRLAWNYRSRLDLSGHR